MPSLGLQMSHNGAGKGLTHWKQRGCKEILNPFSFDLGQYCLPIWASAHAVGFCSSLFRGVYYPVSNWYYIGIIPDPYQPTVP